jgi:hypothetical protein
MKKIARQLTLLATLSLTAGLSAQTAPADGSHRPDRGGPGGPGGPRGRHGLPILRVLDADKDGVISAAEIVNAPALIATLDTNADGVVSAQELRPARPADAPERPAPPADNSHPRPIIPVMLALDANGDGDLSAAEIAAAAVSLKALDLNGDGTLTRDELRPLPPEGAPVGGRPDGGHRPPQ